MGFTALLLVTRMLTAGAAAPAGAQAAQAPLASASGADPDVPTLVRSAAQALLAVAPGADPRPRTPVALVRAALDAMGGEARWRSLASMRVSGTGHQHALEQSERPEGPWLTTYTEVSELRDLEGGRLRAAMGQRGFWNPGWRRYVLVADGDAAALGLGDRWGPAQTTHHAQALERLALAPERILLTALGASDLASVPDTVLQGVPHVVVTFTWDERPVRLFLNAHTHLPAGYALPAADGDFFADIWGDLPTTTLWSLWSLEPGGWLYPRQTDVLRLGRPWTSELLSAVAFDVPAPADSFAIPDDARAAFVAAAEQPSGMGAMRPGTSFRGEVEEAEELAPGVVSIPGAYATTFVEQDDGVVILEGPMTSAWTAAVLDESARRFPGKPVKAVVTTSDAWPHIGGLREHAARGIPILALDLNVPIVEALLAAPRERRRDALALAPRPAEIQAVGGATALGDGPNRIELLPVRGEGGERMMVAWLPQRRVLYASDLVQLQPDGSAFWPEYLLEVVAVVERHGLEPATVFAMHTPPVPWSRVLELLEEVRSGGPAGLSGG